MIPSNPIPQVCNYGSSASYCTCPSDEQIANGVVPLDSLPASWWNWMWSKTNTAVNCARYAAGVLIEEVNSVLTQAGVCVNPSCVDQLYRAINNIRQTIGTADVAGAVKSSSTASEVAIDPTTGKMSVNCLGNAASLTTTATTVVGAINELKSTYDTCWSNNTTALSGKAPNNHASSATTYGVGNADCYGHLKISDQYTSVLSACSGVAASQKAVADVYTYATGRAAVGNTAGCALGTAAAGTATTAARSDHVHPIPTCVLDKYNASQYIGIGYSCPGLTADQIAHLAAYSNNYATNCIIIKDVSKAVVQSWLGLGSAAYCSTSSFRSSTWLPTALGGIAINPGACGNWSEGIRFNRANNGWATVTFGGEANSTNGCTGVFSLHTNCADSLIKKFYVAYQGSTVDSYFVPDGNAGAVRWHGNVTGDVSGALYGCACCAGRDGSGCSFGTAARCAATAFRASDWWPNSKFCGAVCQAYIADVAGSASTAVEADCAGWACRGVVPAANKWDGRSNKSGACWCATAAPAYGGTLFFCNCGNGILLYSIKNGCCCCGGIVPSYGRGTTVCCMCNGTSCAVAWYIYP